MLIQFKVYFIGVINFKTRKHFKKLKNYEYLKTSIAVISVQHFVWVNNIQKICSEKNT